MLSCEDQRFNLLLWSTCSARGIRDTYRCLYQNSECTKLIGTSRTQEAYSKTLAALSHDRQRQWYAWVKGVMVKILDLLVNHPASVILCISHASITHAPVLAIEPPPIPTRPPAKSCDACAMSLHSFRKWHLQCVAASHCAPDQCSQKRLHNCEESYHGSFAAYHQQQRADYCVGLQEDENQDAWTQLQMLEPVLDMFATDQSVRVVSKVRVWATCTSLHALLKSCLTLSCNAYLGPQQLPCTGCCMSLTGLYACWQLPCRAGQAFLIHIVHSLQSTAVSIAVFPTIYAIQLPSCFTQSKQALPSSCSCFSWVLHLLFAAYSLSRSSSSRSRWKALSCAKSRPSTT